MGIDPMHEVEIQRLSRVYGERKKRLASRYDLRNPAVYMSVQEVERALLAWARQHCIKPVSEIALVDVGCGTGGGLLEFIRLGFSPSRVTGIELLPDRAAEARIRLPSSVEVHLGDACALELAGASYDVVYQSTVFTSILARPTRQRLAERMWQWVRPGGGVLWYDFTVDNPWNPDVRGVSIREIRELFPIGTITWMKKLTLLPPIARVVARIRPELYTVFNALLPFLRTHVMCWIQKDSEGIA